MANNMDSIMQVGKSGIGEELITSVDNALEARELIKMTVLETAPLTARDTAEELAAAVGADVVGVVGRKMILFRPSKKKPKITL